MKKTRIAALALSAVLAVTGLAGCGTKVNDKDDQGRTVLDVGNWPAESSTAYAPTMERKDAFEAANPDVVIQPNEWVFDRQTFYAKAAGGQLPTLYQAGYTEAPEIIGSEYAADIASVLKKRGYDGMFNEAVMDIVSEDGKVYGFPNGAYVLGVAYNTELFEKAGLMEADGTPKQPKDWDELAEFAVKIKEATGTPGVVFPTSNKNGGWIFTPVAWSYGVEFMSKDKDGKWQATFDTQEAVDALQYIKDLKWKYDVLPANTLIDGTEYYKTFATGGAAMCVTAGDIPGKVTQYGMKSSALGMMAMPAGPKRHVTLLGGGMYCLKEDATEDQIDAAVRWLETAFNYQATDAYKKTSEDNLAVALEADQVIGINSMSIWSNEAESVQWSREFAKKNTNINLNHVRLYNEFVENCPAEIQAEEPMCAQQLYAILDSCIQEVLQNKDADCAALIKNANNDFQKNYLDNLTY